VTIALADIAVCFEGEIPAMVATCSVDGATNLAHLSHVHLVDDRHVATSNQFFTKTAANLAANPVACLVVVDPTTLHSYKLLLRHVRTEDGGPLFDRVRRSLDAIAAMTGMDDVFALRSVDVFRVLDVALVRSRSTDPPT
jgi:adenylate cyclase